MGVLDKIKNALFEVEYVEVDEAPKKEKKVKEKKEKKEKEEKPIAKKIVLPGKREEKIEELHEEELQDEDFEIRPKEEHPIEEKPHEEFKFMDDKDFTVEEDFEAPEILQVLDENEEVPVKTGRHVDEVEYLEERTPYPEKKPVKKEVYSAPAYRESKPYGVDQSYNVPVHQYGTYERKEEKSYFRPSPIISPIYGILDKNYKKEDVKEKREVHITSSYSRNSLNVDDIRNKAYGEKVETPKKEEVKEEEAPTKFDVDEEDNLLVDLSDRAKPEVKELTMGDALEYFQDLGLEYNVDYVDVSKEKNAPKKVKEEIEEDSVAHDIEKATEDLEPVVEKVQEVKPEEVKEEKKEPEKKVSEDDNDNLFDLIDSMYQEKD